MRSYTFTPHTPHRVSNCAAASTHSTPTHSIPADWIDIELGEPPTELTLPAAAADTLKVMALVRLLTQPLGVVALDVSIDRAWPAHSATIWAALRTQINSHLMADGLVCSGDLESLVTAQVSASPCVQQRSIGVDDSALITVIVATHERSEALRICLNSVLRQDYPRFEVIVVDSDPHTAGTAKLIATNFYPRVQYVREPRQGTAWAYHRGLQTARGNIVAFVDDDVIVDRWWLSGIAHGFASDPGVGCVTGPTLPAKLDGNAELVIARHGPRSGGFEQRFFDPGADRGVESLFAFAAGRYSSTLNIACDATLLRGLGGIHRAPESGTFSRGGRNLSAFHRIERERSEEHTSELQSPVHHVCR